jgi:hypothetical protein
MTAFEQVLQWIVAVAIDFLTTPIGEVYQSWCAISLVVGCFLLAGCALFEERGKRGSSAWAIFVRWLRWGPGLPFVVLYFMYRELVPRGLAWFRSMRATP